MTEWSPCAAADNVPGRLTGDCVFTCTPPRADTEHHLNVVGFCGSLPIFAQVSR